MDARALVFDVGEQVCGWGRLVRTRDGEWFEPPLPQRLIAYGPAGPPPPRPSRFGIPVEAGDFDAVEHRFERDGATEGYAKIHGLWLGDSIRIQRQTNDRPETYCPRWSDPPCDAPPGGWPHGRNGRPQQDLDCDLGDLESAGTAVTTVVFRPSEDQAVLVVAATDVAAVEALLRPQLRDRLCVVPSRWTRAQLDEALQHLTNMFEHWNVYECGTSCDEQAQATLAAKLVRVTDEIVDWSASQPAGLVTLDACLRPVRR